MVTGGKARKASESHQKTRGTGTETTSEAKKIRSSKSARKQGDQGRGVQGGGKRDVNRGRKSEKDAKRQG